VLHLAESLETSGIEVVPAFVAAKACQPGWLPKSRATMDEADDFDEYPHFTMKKTRHFLGVPGLYYKKV
jgi:hypothetical protein